jgi:hypothetical protein
MGMKKRSFLWLTLIMVLCFPRNAYAYIDPGTGSLILQGLAAAFISALVFWRSLRDKIKKFFIKPQDHKNDE